MPFTGLSPTYSDIALSSGDAVFRRFLRPLFGSTSINSAWSSLAKVLPVVTDDAGVEWLVVSGFLVFLLARAEAFFESSECD